MAGDIDTLDECLKATSQLTAVIGREIAIELYTAFPENMTSYKNVKGPCLSLDAPEIMSQVFRLYNIAHDLIQDYKDVLINPGNWRRRLFRLDP